MKFYLLFIFISLNLCSFSARATDTIFVYETQVPILIERQDNMLFLMFDYC
jgi:sialidase-1